MRRRLYAILLALGLPMVLVAGSVLTASPASAQPGQCFSSEGGCFLYNLYTSGSASHLYILGDGHNNSLYSYFDYADVFGFTPKDGNWGILQDRVCYYASSCGLCWNTNGTVIALDSCPSGDTNEYFEWVQHGDSWLIKSYRTGRYVAADRNGGAIYFTSGVNDTSLWEWTT